METVVIETDLPCAICGYNLKGLDTDANCPECGQSVSRTFSSDLTHCPRDWLQRQAVAMLFLAVLEFLSYVGYGSPYASGPYIMRIIFNVMVCVAIMIGVFRLSAPELPVSMTGVWFDPWRRGIRASAVVVFAIRMTGFLPMEQLNERLWQLLVMVGVVALLALNFLVGRYLYRLAIRCRDGNLAAHARLVFWALPLQYIVHFGFALISNGTSFPEVRYYVSTVIVWATAAIELLYLLLLGRMHEKLRSAAARSPGKQAT